MTNETLTTLKERRSCRKFRPEQITEEELAAVLEAGTYAPTARGLQCPKIIAVQNPETVRELNALNALFTVQQEPYYGAPTVVLVLFPAGHPTGVMDASAVTVNMLNAAHAIGLGSCWINRCQYMFETAQGKELLKSWGVEGSWKGAASIALGYPEGEPARARERKKDYCLIIR